jgi:hypothetical protein
MTDPIADSEKKHAVTERLEEQLAHVSGDEIQINPHPGTVHCIIQKGALDPGDETDIVTVADDIPDVELTTAENGAYILNYKWEVRP